MAPANPYSSSIKRSDSGPRRPRAGLPDMPKLAPQLHYQPPFYPGQVAAALPGLHSMPQLCQGTTLLALPTIITSLSPRPKLARTWEMLSRHHSFINLGTSVLLMLMLMLMLMRMLCHSVAVHINELQYEMSCHILSLSPPPHTSSTPSIHPSCSSLLQNPPPPHPLPAVRG